MAVFRLAYNIFYSLLNYLTLSCQEKEYVDGSNQTELNHGSRNYNARTIKVYNWVLRKSESYTTVSATRTERI
jgi:hypothetical protein